MNNNLRALIFRGMRDGLPIGMGYFAVAFSLGIAAANGGMSAPQGFLMSILNHASAGEYAGISAIRSQATFFEVGLLILIANARYLLMSTALSQKLDPKLGLGHRMLIGFSITDEIFGLAIAFPGYLAPAYLYGAFWVACPMWASGTALGIVAGNLLPPLAVTSLSAAIYGMFIAIVIPPSRKNKTILAVVLVSFAASCLFAVLPFAAHISESFRIIILTVIISAGAAVLRPVREEKEAKA